MNNKLVIANWKMNCNIEEASSLALHYQKMKSFVNVDIVACPSLVHLQGVISSLSKTPIKIGSQDASAYSYGAHTGDISASCLRQSGVDYCLIGHSERRHLLGENNALCKKKFETVAKSGLIPVICIGETIEHKRNQKTFDIIKEQLESVFDRNKMYDIDRFVVAYEPVWSIGTGSLPSLDDIAEIHEYIRTYLDSLGGQISEFTSILYGGSVKSDNADAILALPNVDGLLVGGASLNIEEFTAICQSADQA